MGELLDKINKENDIKNIDENEYRRLAREIREFIINNVTSTGGHLASNLGAVELTMALHLCCDLPKDKIIFDVGHQCYTHKLLTGRKEQFKTLRKFNGISGFPRISESDCDVFDTGHSSNSLSLALGLCNAREIKKEDYKVFAVIGDGALSGGMAFEALNNAARLKSNLVIVINDNQMSISKNVGGMANYLGKIRTNKKYNNLKDSVENAFAHLPGGDQLTDKVRGAKDIIKRVFISGMLFEDMGLTYIGPINGHNVPQMVSAFNSALNMNEPVIVHVCTKKGKGYKPAEKNPRKYHGVAAGSGGTKNETYSDVVGSTLIEMAEEDERIVGITAAMPDGTGLTPFMKKFPDRSFDVGIEEEHAVTFAAGLARGGLRPVVAIYSTFFQRAYDQMISDVCLQKLPVVFCFDRSGIVGADGSTHQGIFDTSFLKSMPGLTIMAPADKFEMKEMLKKAVEIGGPVAIKYPRGEAIVSSRFRDEEIEVGRCQVYGDGAAGGAGAPGLSGAGAAGLSGVGGDGEAGSNKKVLIVAVGNLVHRALRVRDELTKSNIDAVVINARFIKPMDEETILSEGKKYRNIVTLEEGVLTGGFGEEVNSLFKDIDGVRVKNIALPDEFIEHGSVEELREKYGLGTEEIISTIVEFVDI